MLKLIGTKNVLSNGGYMNKKKILVVLNREDWKNEKEISCFNCNDY